MFGLGPIVAPRPFGLQAGFWVLGPLWLPRAFLLQAGFVGVRPILGLRAFLLQAGFLVLGERPVEDSVGKAK